MQPKRTWRVALNVRIFFWFALLFFAFIAGSLAWQLMRDSRGQPVWFFVLWVCVALGGLGYLLLRGIISISVDETAVELRSVLRRTQIDAADIVAVEASRWDVNRFSPQIRTRAASFWLAGPFDGFYELLTTLKELNPSIEIRRL